MNWWSVQHFCSDTETIIFSLKRFLKESDALKLEVQTAGDYIE